MPNCKARLMYLLKAFILRQMRARNSLVKEDKSVGRIVRAKWLTQTLTEEAWRLEKAWSFFQLLKKV